MQTEPDPTTAIYPRLDRPLSSPGVDNPFADDEDVTPVADDPETDRQFGGHPVIELPVIDESVSQSAMTTDTEDVLPDLAHDGDQNEGDVKG